MEVELKDTLNKQWKDDKSGFGFRMMQKMGWKEDKGLGKDESGIVDNIKISKREIGLGLGTTDTVDNANRGWSATASSFNDVLAVLKESFQKKDKKKKTKVTKSNPTTTISVGMKYKKFREAKDLSTKTDAEKRAIFGASMPTLSSSSKSASTTNSARSSEPDSSSSSSDEEVVKKSKKAKKDKKEKKEKKSKKTK